MSSTFTWKIPPITNKHKDILCHGYIRENYNKYIPNPIAQLFIKYYINGEYSLNQIKRSLFKQAFHSSVVEIGSFKWFLQLYPNGTTDRNKGEIILFLVLASNPPNTNTISATITLSLKETNSTKTLNHTFNHPNNYYYGWTHGFAKIDDIKNLNQLTFILKIDKILTNNNNYKEVEVNPIAEQINTKLTIINYQWRINNKNELYNIKNASNCSKICSMPFDVKGIKWALNFFFFFFQGREIRRR